MTEEKYFLLEKQAIKKKYGLSSETFNFYVQVGVICEHDGILFKVSSKIDDIVLEKGTVFRYCFEDNWRQDIREFADTYQYRTKVKVYTKEEIELLNKKLKKDPKLLSKVDPLGDKKK